jgi:uncharacterized protein (DUF2147 family)
MILFKQSLKSVRCLAVLVLFIALTSFTNTPPERRLVGIWESEEKNLRIEMFEENGHFAGRMIWFLCSSGESKMYSYLDTENPDRNLSSRPLIGLKVVEKLSYQGNNTWGSGKIYDPNSGHTYDARIHMTLQNTVIVRGYWKFSWFGKSMVFNRLE